MFPFSFLISTENYILKILEKNLTVFSHHNKHQHEWYFPMKAKLRKQETLSRKEFLFSIEPCSATAHIIILLFSSIVFMFVLLQLDLELYGIPSYH